MRVVRLEKVELSYSVPAQPAASLESSLDSLSSASTYSMLAGGGEDDRQLQDCSQHTADCWQQAIISRVVDNNNTVCPVL